jgi:hypothetical protein
MEIKFLAKAFGVWDGYAYRFSGTLPEQTDPASFITGKISQLMQRNDFVSSVIELKGHHYVYVKSQLPSSEEFVLLGDLKPVYQEPEESEPDTPSEEQGEQ